MSNAVALAEKEAMTVEIQTDKGPIKLSPSIVRRYLVNGNGSVTDGEVMMFMSLCKFQGLNPFLREAYLIKYGNSAATIVTGKDAFLKRARNNPDFEGYRAGVIVISKDGEIKETEGFCPPEHTIVGGWAEVYVKSWKFPLKVEVDFAEYVGRKSDGSVTTMWQTKKATMIRKCFDDRTSVLTNAGFKLFQDITDDDLVAQVTDDRKIQFVLPTAIIRNPEEEQDLFVNTTSKLDMAVTMDHRVTVLEDGALVEKLASDIYDSLRQRSRPMIPRTALLDSEGNTDWCNAELDLVGFYLADGHEHTKYENGIKVAKKYKIDALRDNGLFASCREIPYDGPVVCIDRVIEDPLPQVRFLYSREVTRKIKTVVGPDKFLSWDKLRSFSPHQLRRIIDAWILFDGCEYNKQKQLFTSRDNHVRMSMLIGVLAGYSVKWLRSRNAGFKDNHVIIFSDIPNVCPQKVHYSKQEYHGATYCVSVPSGRIIVKRDGYSHISGNCALVQALREAFPAQFNGMYSEEEMNNVDANELPRNAIDPEIIDITEPKHIEKDQSNGNGGTSEPAQQRRRRANKFTGLDPAMWDGKTELQTCGAMPLQVLELRQLAKDQDNRKAIMEYLAGIGYESVSFLREDEAKYLIDILSPVDAATTHSEPVSESAETSPDDLVACPMNGGDKMSRSGYCLTECPIRRKDGFCPILGEAAPDGGLL